MAGLVDLADLVNGGGAAGRIVALLGPTNTGKTWQAIQRMVAHRSGMIGLPLRLLAREVYERVVEAKGADQVALVTGEEKRIPRSARYWVCTTESMPVDRAVAFVAVDEIQLAADRARGHVFTDRILHARGLLETWFLGSDTIEPLLRQLVPTVQVERRPRLSALRYRGHRKLLQLPPRSAVVAFQAAGVYQLAERLRARHGGAAVVMGALSPRARNAQVGLFESGEVSYLVATDAIGMGLNMDVHHVALADTRKFDGVEHRALRADEIAQVAGRAGRYRRDGTFGTTDAADPLDDPDVDAIERHDFPALRRLSWRSSALCFDSITALQLSLSAPPPRHFLTPVRHADDAEVLARLAADPEVARRVRGADTVKMLWDTASIPDFGGVLVEHHAQVLATVFRQRIDHGGVVPPAWLEPQVARLDRIDGEVEALTTRLAGVRLWASVCHRPGWVDDAAGWQERLRDLEDRLGERLHQRLTARFVDSGVGAVVRRPTIEIGEPVLDPAGGVSMGGQRIGALRGLSWEAAQPDLGAEVRAAVARVVRPVALARAERLAGDVHGAFGVDVEGGVRWDGARVAVLVAGPTSRRPRLRLLRSDLVDGAARDAVARRLDRWLADWLAEPEASWDRLPAASPAGRALRHALREGPGAVTRVAAEPMWRAMPEPERRTWLGAGLRRGERHVWWPAVLGDPLPRWVRWRVFRAANPIAGVSTDIDLPEGGGEIPFIAALDPGDAASLGLVRVGRAWIRVDAWEAVHAEGVVAARRLGGDASVWEAAGLDVRAWDPGGRR